VSLPLHECTQAIIIYLKRPHLDLLSTRAAPHGCTITGEAYQGRGRVQMLLGQTARTSGRRLAAWGPAYATYVHALISVKWYFGASYTELHGLYRTMYSDAYR
jgi:hypothetical protein